MFRSLEAIQTADNPNFVTSCHPSSVIVTRLIYYSLLPQEVADEKQFISTGSLCYVMTNVLQSGDFPLVLYKLREVETVNVERVYEVLSHARQNPIRKMREKL